MNDAITASEARRDIFKLIERVNNDRTPVEILSKGRDAYLVGGDEYRSLQETAHLLRSPANAQRLLESIAQLRQGHGAERELVWDD